MAKDAEHFINTQFHMDKQIAQGNKNNPVQ